MSNTKRRMSDARKEQMLEEDMKTVDMAVEMHNAQIGRLQARIIDLENQIKAAPCKDDEKLDRVRECAACEHMVNKALENHPTLRELRDKFEKYHFKLMEYRNENYLLKRDLSIAKKVICQELGINSVDFQYLLRHSTHDGFRGRKEKLLLMKQKNKSLEQKIKIMEGRPDRPKTTPSEEMAVANISDDRKSFWRMELEKRKGYQLGDKERMELAEENLDLRRKLEQNKSRMRELVAEIQMLKGEVFAFSEKSRGDHVIIQSLQNTEDQLKTVLEDRSDIRRQMIAEKARNTNLQEQINYIKEQLQMFKDRSVDDRLVIDALSCQNKRQQAMLENEQMMGHQAVERFKEELRKMKVNHVLNSEIVDKMQAAIAKRDEIVGILREKLDEITKYMEEKAEQEAAAAEAEEGEGEGEGEEGDEKPDEKAAEEAEEEEPAPEIPPEIQELQMDLSKYKTLYEASKIQEQNLTQMISSLNQKVDMLSVKLIETQQCYLQNDFERKDLQEKINRMDRAKKAAKKKKTKIWERESGKSIVPTQKSKVEELEIKLDVLGEENNFLRSFLTSAVGAKEEDFTLYQMVAENAEKHFETSIEALKNEFAAARKEGENEEVEDEEDPESAS